MSTTGKEYNEMAKKASPNSPKVLDCIKAFSIGGLICLIGEVLNTLYKMLWNPENPGTHQYATDIGWAVKQAVSIEKIFSSFTDATLSFDVPVYSGQIPPTVTMD